MMLTKCFDKSLNDMHSKYKEHKESSFKLRMWYINKFWAMFDFAFFGTYLCET